LGNPFAKGLLDNLNRLCTRDKRNWKPEEILVYDGRSPRKMSFKAGIAAVTGAQIDKMDKKG
jgi:hypothetical protein